MDKLKPCPFCGGEADVIVEHGRVWVECGNCHCGTALMYGVSPTEEKIKVAATDWNRRVSDGK